MKDIETTPDCCPVWTAIKPSLRWFGIEGETTLLMPCFPGTDWRVNFCPSCGADRRGVEDDTRTLRGVSLETAATAEGGVRA